MEEKKRSTTIDSQPNSSIVSKDDEGFYKDLVESSPDLIWQCDAEGRYVFLNRACSKIFGYTREEMIGRKFTDFMTPQQAKKDLETFSAILTKGAVRAYETVHLHKDGTEIHLSFNADNIRDDDESIIGTRGIAQDITERKVAQRELAESRQRYREMVMQSPMGMHFYDLVDNDLVFSDFNPAADRLLGVSNAEFVGQTILNAFPPLANTEVPARYMEAARHGKSWSTEQVVYADEQITGAFEVHAFQIAPMKMVAVFMDITERKRAEESLRNEKELVSVTLGSIGDGVIATDVNGVVTLMNKVAETLTGWDAAGSLEKPLKKIFNITDELTGEPLENPVEQVLRTSSVVEMSNHTMLVSRDGTMRQIADSGAPIFNDEGKIIGVVLVFRDVTEKTRMNQAVQRTQKLESLGMLAGGIAHDFNNLLGGIFGYLDLARNMSSNAEVTDYLEKAFFTMERARGLTQQLLTFSKGGLPVLKTIDPAPFVERTARFISSGSNVSLEFDFDPDLKHCQVDETQFGQVIDNIVLNAQQSMPLGGRIHITGCNETIHNGEHPILEAGAYVNITISDTGLGIPNDILPNIFDPFFTTKQKGSGLGLATCHSIISKHDGSIDVVSQMGKGSSFTIRIPSSDVQKQSVEPAHEARKTSGRILVMDDEDYIREILGQMLESFGYDAILTQSGEQAIEVLGNQTCTDKCDAAILDLTVPGGMGGKETAKRIGAIDPELPVFLSSGYSDDPVISEPEKYGFSGSIIKPFRMEDVANLLSQFLPEQDDSNQKR